MRHRDKSRQRGCQLQTCFPLQFLLLTLTFEKILVRVIATRRDNVVASYESRFPLQFLLLTLTFEKILVRVIATSRDNVVASYESRFPLQLLP